MHLKCIPFDSDLALKWRLRTLTIWMTICRRTYLVNMRMCAKICTSRFSRLFAVHNRATHRVNCGVDLCRWSRSNLNPAIESPHETFLNCWEWQCLFYLSTFARQWNCTWSWPWTLEQAKVKPCKYANWNPVYDYIFVGNNNVCLICNHLPEIRNRNVYDLDLDFWIGQCQI